MGNQVIHAPDWEMGKDRNTGKRAHTYNIFSSSSVKLNNISPDRTGVNLRLHTLLKCYVVSVTLSPNLEK